MKKIIETERLILRPFEDRDVEAVLEFNSHPEVIRYTGNELIISLQDAQNIIDTIWKRDYNIQGYGRMAVVYKPDNKVIGFSGLKWETDLGETDIGYRFLPEYWGRGIATESCIPLLQYGFEELGLHRIVGLAYPENIASCKVLEKIGLQHYKTAPFTGEEKDCYWYKKDNPKSQAIEVRKSIKASQTKIWAALTNLEEMQKWYFEQLQSFEPRLGFSTEFIIHHNNKTFTHQWTITNVIPMDSISYSWNYAEYEGRSISSFNIKKIDDGFEVSVTCLGLQTFPSDVPEFHPESCLAGWEYFMTELKKYCEA